MACPSGGAGHGGIQGLSVGSAGGNIDIADPLPGQGQGLGVGIADNGIPVDGGNEGNLHPVGQLPVGLIGDKIDGVAIGSRLLFQKGAQSGQRLTGVDHAGGVVGGVDEDGLGAGGDHGLQPGEVNLEAGNIRGHHPESEPCFFGEGLILREVGGNGQNFPAGNGQGPENADQLRRGAAAQEEFLRFCGYTIAGVQIVGNGGSCFQITGGGGVAVDQQRVHIRENIPDGLVYLRGRGDGGVADGVIKHILRPHNGGPAAAVLKQLPDAGAVGPQPIGFFIDHTLTFFPGQENVPA